MSRVEVIQEKGKTVIKWYNETPICEAIWDRELTDEEIKIVIEAGLGKKYPEDFKNEKLEK